MHPSASDRDLARRFGADVTIEQALNPGLRRWHTDDAFVAYAPGRRVPAGPVVRVAAGGPVCAPDRLGAVAEAFERDAAEGGEGVCWFGADERVRTALPAHTALVVGAQPVWTPTRWPDILASKASLRAQVRRAENKGVEVEAWPRETAAASGALRAILDDWLARRGMPSLHFLAEPDVLGSLGDRETFVAVRDGRPVAYLLLSPVPARDGLFVEWILQGRQAPNGTAALLLDAAFGTAIDRDASFVSLGLVPLSSHAPLSEAAPSAAIRALLAWMRAHARRFYNFEGLERFKGKFLPDAWEPVYLLTPEPRISVPLLHALADAFAGPRSPEALVGRALVRAATQEVRTAGRWLSLPGS